MSAKPTINNDLHIYVVGSSKFQPRSLEETGATVSRRHTGLKMIQLEDIGWRKQVAKEVARVKPDLLVFAYEDLADCTELSPDASAWAKELLVAGGAKEVCVLDSVGSCRWKYLEGSVLQEDEREVERYFCRGDLVVGTGSQALGEVLSNWANQDHDIHY